MGIFSEIKRFLQRTGKTIKKEAKKARKTADTIGKGVDREVQKAGETLETIGKAAGSAVQDVVKAVSNVPDDVAKSVAAAKHDLDQLTTPIGDLVEGKFNEVASTIGGAFNAIGSAIVPPTMPEGVDVSAALDADRKANINMYEPAEKLVERLNADNSESKSVRTALSQGRFTDAGQKVRTMPEYKQLEGEFREAGMNSFTLSVAADVSVIVGINADISGAAFDTAWKENVYWFASVGYGAGISAGIDVSVSLGWWRPPNFCLGGSGWCASSAAQYYIGLQYALWYPTWEIRNKYTTFPFPSFVPNIRGWAPEKAIIGRTISPGIGIGLEISEFNNTWTIQVPGTRKSECTAWFENNYGGTI